MMHILGYGGPNSRNPKKRTCMSDQARVSRQAMQLNIGSILITHVFLGFLILVVV